MQRTSILEFTALLQLGAPSRTSTANWLNFSCPFAPWKHQSKRDRSASFGVSVSDTEHSHYWCFTCKSKGPFASLAYELSTLRGRDYIGIGKEIEKQELLGPRIVLRKWDDQLEVLTDASATQDRIIWPNPGRQYEFLSAAGHPYLRERGIGVTAAIAMGLRFDPWQGRILFPVHDERGRFAGFTGRRVDRPFRSDDEGDFERNGEPYLKVRDYFGLRKAEFFLGERGARVTGTVCRHDHNGRRTAPPSFQRITLVEGLFDYAYLIEVGFRGVVAILGTALTPAKVAKLVRWQQPVVLFLDNDQPGHDAVQQCKDYLFGRVPLLTVKYPDGFEGADPASLPPSVARAMYNSAELVLKP